MFIEGVVNLRGTVIPVIEMRKRFGLDPSRDFEPRMIIVNVDEIPIGITVDHVLAGMSWAPRVAQPLGLTRPFGEEEIAALRRIDPEGFWTGAAGA